jgi:glutamate dehydrogenase (NAD(P)+)
MIIESVQDPKTGLSAALVVLSERGLAFGGTRFSAQCTTPEVVELAQGMGKKLAPHTLAVGGAKAGFFCDPDHPGLADLVQLAAEKWQPLLAGRVVLGKDMGASNALMDGFYACVGHSQLTPVAGSQVPARLRDFVGYRAHMTGQGISWSLSEYFKGPLQGVRVAIQGFGAVGLGAAIRLTRAGVQILGLSDINGTIVFAAAPTEAELLSLAQAGGVRSVASPSILPHSALFSMDVDAVVLAANSHSVTAGEAETLRAQVLVEGSNFGLCSDARALLRGQDFPVIPDWIASSASAAMVALQMEAGGTLAEAELWKRIEANIRSQTRSLFSPA